MHGLNYLLRGYFHQDWNHTYSTWQEVIDEFLGDHPDEVAQTPIDIEQLLAETSDEIQLEERLDELGLDYLPREGYRAWLMAVRDRILVGTGPSESPQSERP